MSAASAASAASAVEVALARLQTTSRRRRSRRLTVSLGLALAAVVVMTASLLVGELPLSLGQVLATAVGRGDDVSQLVLVDFRLPRLLLGVLVGAGLALSGALFQSVLRNPLASPDIIGVAQGASVGAVLVTIGLGLSGLWLPLGALAGALLVAALNLALAWRRGLTGQRFVLCGIALAFVASSVLGYLLTRSEVRAAQGALVWLAGSVSSAEYAGILRLAVPLLVLVPLALVAGRRLAMLEMGDDAAQAVGGPASAVRVAAIGIGVALAGVATASAGPVAFVALTSAPIARRLVGDGGIALVPTALVGVLVVTVSDFAAQHLVPGIDVPVGIVTGVIGGPYLIWLLAGGRRPRRNR